MLCYPPDPPLTFRRLTGLRAAHRRGGPSFVTLISAAGHILTGTAPNTQRNDNKGERRNYCTLSIIKHVITAQGSIGGIRLYKSRGREKHLQTAWLHACVFYHQHLLSYKYPWGTSEVTDSNIKKIYGNWNHQMCVEMQSIWFGCKRSCYSIYTQCWVQ